MIYLTTTSLKPVIETDVCIIGAGPAGLTLAYELGQQQIATTVIEAGQINVESRRQNWLCADQTRPFSHYPDPSEIAAHGLGGTAHWWGNALGDYQGLRLMPLDPIDLYRENNLDDGNWPISYDELARYYPAALTLFGLNSDYAKEFSLEKTSLSDSAQPLQHRQCFFANRRPFLDTLPEYIRQSTTVDCLLDAYAYRLEGSNEQITGLCIVDSQGQQRRVQAKRFVLALGGLGNPRLLLSSYADNPDTFGEAPAYLGRCLHDHPTFVAGTLHHPNPERQALFSSADTHLEADLWCQSKFMLNPDLLDQQGLRNTDLFLFPNIEQHQRIIPFTEKTRRFSPIIGPASRRLRENLRGQRPLGKQTLRDLIEFARDPQEVQQRLKRWLSRHSKQKNADSAHGGWSQTTHLPRSFRALHFFDQTPDFDNRVTLSTQRNSRGLHALRVHWRIHPDDEARLQQSQKIYQQQFADLGIGTLALLAPNGHPYLYAPSSHHPSGTTRLSSNPDTGVFDANLRSHQFANLYALGSSLFPRSGSANPTLSIVALAIRLAEHLGRPRPMH